MPTEHRHHYHRTYSSNVKSFANAVMYIKYIHRPIALLSARRRPRTFPLFRRLSRSFVRFIRYVYLGLKEVHFKKKKQLRVDFLCVLATFIHQGFDFYFCSLILCCCFIHTPPSWPSFSTFISIKHVPR